jgi:hypothetical protein
MSAFWQALDWCAHHDPGTPTFLEFYGGRGGGPTTPHAGSTSFGLPWPLCCLCLAWLAAWLARWLVAGWLLGWLARWLVAAWLPGWLFA